MRKVVARMVPDAVNGAPEHTPEAVNEANKVCGL